MIYKINKVKHKIQNDDYLYDTGITMQSNKIINKNKIDNPFAVFI